MVCQAAEALSPQAPSPGLISLSRPSPWPRSQSGPFFHAFAGLGRDGDYLNVGFASSLTLAHGLEVKSRNMA